MAFEGLKDQFKEQFAEIWNKIQESPTYNNLLERYESLTPATQKGIWAGVIVVSVLLIVSVPFSFFSSSSDQVAEFETNRSMLRELLRASRHGNLDTGSSFANPTIIKDRISNDLMAKGLQSDQIGPVVDLPMDAMGGQMAPAPITQTGIGVSLKGLNLRQIVDIGFALQNLHAAVKLSGMEVRAQLPDPHYFDVLFKVAVFGEPGGSQNEAQPSPETESDNDEEGP